MRSSLEKERVLILGSMLLIAILAAVVPFALRIPTLAESFTASAGCPTCFGKVTGGGQIGLLTGCPPTIEGKATFGFNIVRYPEGDSHEPHVPDPPKGELQYVDHLTGMKIHGHEMASLVVVKEVGCWRATFTGIDMYTGKTFTVEVHDHDEPGEEDFFIITLDGYSASGTPILNGNIQVHKKP